jgi:FMN phosphatase YigB (HAD superfamily)
VTQILFELYSVLVDKLRLLPCYTKQVGQVMAEHFGGEPQSWTAAQSRIVEDWDSYYADLDLNGEHALDDLREGQIRTTRALFRITNIPEPDRPTLTELAQNLPYLVSCRCDALYSDVKPVLERLYGAGYTLGIASYLTSVHARGILEGGDILTLFKGSILCPDLTERFSKDRDFFGTVNTDCIVVDAQVEGLRGAKAAGLRTIQLLRDEKPPSPHADHILRGSLDGLLDYLDISHR